MLLKGIDDYLLNSILNIPNEGFILVKISGSIIDINETGLNRIGKTKLDDVINKNIFDFFPDDLKKKRKEKFQEVIETKIMVRYDDYYNGIYVDHIYNPIFDKNNELIYIAINTRDITSFKLKEIENRKYLKALEQSANCVVITDLDGNIEYVNKKFSELTGYTNDEALGKNPRILKSDEKDQYNYKKLWDTITSGNIWKGEFKNKKSPVNFIMKKLQFLQ